MPERPSISKQKRIDRRATSMVEEWLQQEWFVRRRDPDFFLDYELEHQDRNEPSGNIIYVQQKGTEKLCVRGGSARLPMKAKHLRYYAEKIRVPVFLFLVDTVGKDGYFLFIQEWLDQGDRSTRIQSQKKLTVEVPLSQRIHDTRQLLERVNEAQEYMREKHPGSVEAAIRADQLRVQKIDPRLDVKLNVVDGTKHYTLIPKKPVQFTLKFDRKKAAKLIDEMQRMVDFGGEIELPSDQGVSLEGAPLVDQHLRKDGSWKLQIQSEPVRPFEVYLSCDDPENRFRLRLEGRAHRGRKGAMFSCGLEDCPLSLEWKMLPVAKDGSASLEAFAVGWDWSRWIGQDLLVLPYAEPLLSFWRMREREVPFRLEVFYKGNRLLSADCASQGKVDSWAIEFFDIIGKARAVCSKRKVGCKLLDPGRVSSEMIRAIRCAYDLVVAGEHHIKDASGYEVSGKINVESPANIDKMTADRTWIKFTHGEESFRVFESEVGFKNVERTFGLCRIHVNAKDRKELKAGRKASARVSIRGCKNAQMWVRWHDRDGPGGGNCG